MPFQVRVDFLVHVGVLFKLGADLGQVLLERLADLCEVLTSVRCSLRSGMAKLLLLLALQVACTYKHTYTIKETNLSSRICNSGGCASSCIQTYTHNQGGRSLL